MSLFPRRFGLFSRNPLFLFVYGILGKWYITIFVAAVIVAFWVLKGLSDSGVLKQTENVVSDALNQTKAVAKFCVPKITDLHGFWDCLQNPPTYSSSPAEKQLEENVKRVFDPANYNSRDPYDNHEE